MRRPSTTGSAFEDEAGTAWEYGSDVLLQLEQRDDEYRRAMLLHPYVKVFSFHRYSVYSLDSRRLA